VSAAETPDTSDYVLDDQIGYLLRLATQRHVAIFQAHMTGGLTPTQFAVLVRLDDVGPSSQNHLGRLAHLDVATVKGVVDRLLGKGLVDISQDESDSRRRVIALSARGRALLPRLQAAGQAITAETLAPLDETERETLLRLLGKLS